MNVTRNPTLDEAQDAARLLMIYAAQRIIEVAQVSPEEAEMFDPPIEDWDLQRIEGFQRRRGEEMETMRRSLLALIGALDDLGVWLGRPAGGPDKRSPTPA